MRSEIPAVSVNFQINLCSTEIIRMMDTEAVAKVYSDTTGFMELASLRSKRAGSFLRFCESLSTEFGGWFLSSAKGDSPKTDRPLENGLDKTLRESDFREPFHL